MNKKLEELVTELDKCQQVQNDAFDKLQKASSGPLFEEMEMLFDQKEKIDERISKIKEEIAKANPESAAAFATAVEETGKKSAEVRQYCHSLPANEVSKGFSVKVGSIKVSVHKVNIIKRYKPEILDALPWLRKEEVDGDPVVVEQVQPYLIERMINQDRLLPIEVEPFVEEIKERTPSVIIMTNVPEDEDAD